MTHPNSTILMHSGARIDLRAPRPEQICLEDIAHHLARIGRFTGAGDCIASVAQHCVHVSLLCPEHLARWGLLHDASEAYLGDCSSPLKSLLLEYRQLEAIWQDAISKRFGVPQVNVKYYDIASMLTERRDNGPFGMTDQEWMGLPPAAELPHPDPKPWVPWGPHMATAAYLGRAAELGIS